jgi:peptidyl-prolyl cis-trans isomerase B (cyclophilin B)
MVHARSRVAARLGSTALVFGGLLALGCGGRTNNEAGKTDEAKQEQRAKLQGAAAAGSAKRDPGMHRPFQEATLADAPDGQELPAQTMTGKSVGKLYTQVVDLWNTISFEAASGKRLNYRALLQTDLGTIEIVLWPDNAPNHVRNFVALARAGYYDGLVFERTVHEESDVDEMKKAVLDYVEAGCPLGTGDPAYGSIGYWMKPEMDEKVHHEEGTVGAWHAEEADTAACKFYITLTKAPIMDGNFTAFGKVTKGLDVVRKIASRPLRPDSEIKDRPENPVVIRKVTIVSSEAAK